MNSLRQDLLAQYRRIGHIPPAWAYPLPPSIPFIGKDYGRWGGLLVYASAENLAHYERKPAEARKLREKKRAYDRHRAAFDDDPGDFFPQVHMAPFEGGGLLVAAWYYLRTRREKMPDDPRALLESIAAANFCKFSIRGKTNRDYARDRAKVEVSVPYVEADLIALRPAAIILPKSIWQHQSVRDAISSVVPADSILRLPQFNSTVVNTHLAKHAKKAQALRARLAGTVAAAWIAKMNGYADGAPYRFLAEMDEVLKKRRS